MKRGKVFISYARQDIEVARNIFLELKSQGFSPWMDKPPLPYENYGLLPGEFWDVRLKSEIKDAQFLIAILSSNSVQKKGYVQREFRLALDLMNEIPSDGLFLFPLLLDDCDIPAFTIGTISFHDLNWHYYPNGGLKPIIVSMRRILIQTPVNNDLTPQGYTRKPIVLRSGRKSDLNIINTKNYQRTIESNPYPYIEWKVFIGKQKWKNNPIMFEDKVIVGSAGTAWNASDEFDGIYALNKNNGEILWKVITGNDANEVILFHDVVFSGSDDGEIFRINVHTGEVVWCRVFEGQFHVKPVICKSSKYDYCILVIDYYGAILLVEPDNGDLVDGIKTKYNFRSSPVLVGDNQYAIVAESGDIIRITIKDEIDIRELKNLDTEVYSTPIYIKESNALIVGSAGMSYFNNEKIRAVCLSTGKIIWKNDESLSLGNIRANLLRYKGKIILGGTYSNKLISIDLESGKVSNEIKLGAETFPQWSSPCVDKLGLVYLPRNDGYVYQVNSVDFKLMEKVYLSEELVSRYEGNEMDKHLNTLDMKWRNVFYSTPVVENGKLYIGNDEGYFYRVNFR